MVVSVNPAESAGAVSSSATAADDVRLAWLALSLAPGLGPRRILQAVQNIGSVTGILELSLTDLEALRFPATAVQYISGGQALRDAEEELRVVRAEKASLLTYGDAAYPERLKEIFDPPPLLWVRGDVKLLARPAIAVVGTRHPTTYGVAMSEILSRDLSLRGLIVLSGMARGVDTAAHRGALEAKSTTIAVWGTGIDVVYPKENKSLAERILHGGGAVVSEYKLGTFPAPQNFPRRNRLLSGMSVGVLVVEAGEHSGTRVTARCAIEQNRDVYAVPGNVTNKTAWGPNTLIKQGAKLVATWEDVWEELPTQIRVQLEARLGGRYSFESNDEAEASLFKPAPLGHAEALVFGVLRHDEALLLDEILDKLEAELSSSEVFTALFELELSGRVKQLPGRNYVKNF